MGGNCRGVGRGGQLSRGGISQGQLSGGQKSGGLLPWGKFHGGQLFWGKLSREKCPDTLKNSYHQYMIYCKIIPTILPVPYSHIWKGQFLIIFVVNGILYLRFLTCIFINSVALFLSASQEWVRSFTCRQNVLRFNA